MSTYICRFCKTEHDYEDRNHDAGLALARWASYEALGHSDHVSAYLICNTCANGFIESGWMDE